MSKLLKIVFLMVLMAGTASAQVVENPSFETTYNDGTCERPSKWNFEDDSTGYTGNGNLCINSDSTDGSNSVGISWTGNSNGNEAFLNQTVSLTGKGKIHLDLIGPSGGNPQRSDIKLYVDGSLAKNCGYVTQDETTTCTADISSYTGLQDLRIAWEQRSGDNLGNARVDNLRLENREKVFDSPQSYTWTVPEDVYKVSVEVWGAEGAGNGGIGGYVSVNKSVSSGDSFTIDVGGAGSGTTGGENGGGQGGTGYNTGEGGGGYTQVVYDPSSAELVAGGGGGSGGAAGGDGGPNTGEDGGDSGTGGGDGGSQSSGGSGGSGGGWSGSSGSKYQGGDGADADPGYGGGGGGGGAGYYGGGGGGGDNDHSGGGGGGGSNYIGFGTLIANQRGIGASNGGDGKVRITLYPKYEPSTPSNPDPANNTAISSQNPQLSVDVTDPDDDVDVRFYNKFSGQEIYDEDFESQLNGFPDNWEKDEPWSSDTTAFQVDDTASNSGLNSVYSLDRDTGGPTYTVRAYRNFGQLYQPETVSLAMNWDGSPDNNAGSGQLFFSSTTGDDSEPSGNDERDEDRVFEAKIDETGELNATGLSSTISVSQDTWHTVEWRNIDWSSKTADLYIDGSLEQSGLSFTSTNNGIDTIYHFNDDQRFYFDDVRMENETESLIGTDTGVSNAERAQVTWNNRECGQDYWWYAEADDGETVKKSEPWTFTVSCDNGPKASDPNPDDDSSEATVFQNVSALFTDPDSGSGTLEYYNGSDSLIGSCTVSNNSRCEVNYSSASESGQTYEWYAVAKDGGNSFTSPVWNFTTDPAPSASNPEPVDGATGIDLKPTVNATYNDQDGDTGDMSIYAGDGSFIGSCTDLSPGDYCTKEYSNADRYSRTYEWYVRVYDQSTWVRVPSGNKWKFDTKSYGSIAPSFKRIELSFQDNYTVYNIDNGTSGTVPVRVKNRGTEKNVDLSIVEGASFSSFVDGTDTKSFTIGNDTRTFLINVEPDTAGTETLEVEALNKELRISKSIEASVVSKASLEARDSPNEVPGLAWINLLVITAVSSAYFLLL